MLSIYGPQNKTIKTQNLVINNKVRVDLKQNISQNGAVNNNKINNQEEEAKSKVDSQTIGDSIIKGINDYQAPEQTTHRKSK